jgi:hypothetical protein
MICRKEDEANFEHRTTSRVLLRSGRYKKALECLNLPQSWASWRNVEKSKSKKTLFKMAVFRPTAGKIVIVSLG